jgi:hypothetical protein
MLFDHADRNQLAALGEVRAPSIADLFVAVVGNQANQHLNKPKPGLPGTPDAQGVAL